MGTIKQQESVAGYVCEDCGALFKEDDENVDLENILYCCRDCGTFSLADTDNLSNQCPECHKFGSRLGLGCPQCEYGTLCQTQVIENSSSELGEAESNSHTASPPTYTYVVGKDSRLVIDPEHLEGSLGVFLPTPIGVDATKQVTIEPDVTLKRCKVIGCLDEGVEMLLDFSRHQYSGPVTFTFVLSDGERVSEELHVAWEGQDMA